MRLPARQPPRRGAARARSPAGRSGPGARPGARATVPSHRCLSHGRLALGWLSRGCSSRGGLGLRAQPSLVPRWWCSGLGLLGLLAERGAHRQVLPRVVEQSDHGVGGDGQPGGPVAGLVDDLVEGLVELERVSSAASSRGSRPDARHTRRGRPRWAAVDPVRALRPGVGLLPRPAGVVERAQHAGDVAHGEVGPAALGERPQRLALEVEQHPAALGDLEHLAEVVVAVDPLQRRPVRVDGPVEDRGDPVLVRREGRHLGRGGDVAPAHAARPWRRSPRGRPARCGSTCGQAGVHLGGRRAELARRVGEVLAVGDGAQRHPPRVLGAGEELLGEGEVAVCRASPSTAAASRADACPTMAGHARRAGLGEGALHDDVGVLAGLQRAEHLADQRFWRRRRVDAVEDDRGVGLLAGQDPRAAQGGLGRPRRVSARHDGGLGGVGLAAGLGRRLLEDEGQQLGGVDRVVGAVVDPAGARGRCAPWCRPARAGRPRAARRGR